MYIEVKPSEKLSEYIESFWITKDVQEDRTSIVEPDGCFDIVVYIHKDFNRVLLTGIWDKPVEVNSYKGVDILGVRLFPKSLACFFDMSIGELRNINMEVDAIKFRKPIDIEILKHSKDINEMISFYELIFEDLLANEYALIAKLMDEIGLENNISEISESIGVSRRHLARVTKEQLGISPKSYVNIIRFIKAKKMLLEGERLSDIVYECGYYDQSHLTKAFKKYTGKTPTDY